MAKDIQKVILVRPQYQVNRGAVKFDSGLATKYVASALFDTAGTDSAGEANTTIAAHPLGVFIPTKAIITRAWWDVITTFTSATDAATIALKAQTAGDIVAAIAISATGDVWDAGLHAGLPGFPNLGADAAHDSAIEVAALFAATFIKTTAERELTATVAVEALTAGKAILFVEYYISA